VIAGREPLPQRGDPAVRADWEYYELRVKPLLRKPGIHFIGEVDTAKRAELLGGALALLNPIAWDEPFGLVMAESFACGTPVLATRRGSVPEVVEDRVTGRTADSESDLAAAVCDINDLDRGACRAAAEARFSPQVMANGYLRVYERTIGDRDAPKSSHSPFGLVGAGANSGEPAAL
jgi:glycosyltransferase involved in cell wall biosynthesis